MRKSVQEIDYDTYKEIMGELLRPIAADGLDDDTLRRLYESKLVYLQNLREKCFVAMNSSRATHFCAEDQQLIVTALHQTKAHLRELIILTIVGNISRRKVS
jgi:hypothetical protein